MRIRAAAMSNHTLTRAVLFACISVFICGALGQSQAAPDAAAGKGDVTAGVELARHENEFSAARIEPARMGGQLGISIVFTGTHDLHYYASPKTAPAPGLELKVEAESDAFDFGKAVFPRWQVITDPTGAKVEVYAGNFTVFIAITVAKSPAQTGAAGAEVKIAGITCTSMLCLPPFEKTLQATIDWSRRDSWKQIDLQAATDTGTPADVAAAPAYSTWFALALAFAAGLALNVMPCVWPILPIVIMRIVDRARAGRRQSMMMGLAFCAGILLFFACVAGANIILHSFYDRTLSWGDHLRNPVIVTALALLMVVMALFMFGVFTVTVPSSIAGKSGSGKGYAGSVGMGFLAAILSTPCSFGILTVAFVWAQGQSLPLGTLAIMVIGLGMALPYAILTSMPGWLNRLPQGGRWTDLFKQALGFLLLLIAVKLVKAVPEANKVSLLYFAVVLSFCVWMWGTWVTFGTKLSPKILVRGMAVVLAVSAFWFFFRPEIVDWKSYDRVVIETARSESTPVLVKFTAGWCTNCEVVDKFVYQRKDVARLIDRKGVVAVKGDTTEANQPATLDLKNVYNEPGVPVTILFLPGRAEPVRLHNLFFGDELIEWLEKLPDKK